MLKTLSAAASKLPSARSLWRGISLILVFALTLSITVPLATVALNVISPAEADDAGAFDKMMADINSLTTSVSADLTSFGFTADDAYDVDLAGAVAAVTGTPSPAAKSGTAVVAPAQSSAVASSPSPALTATATSSPTPALPVWDRKGRVNILLMGLDGTASQGRYRRADSLIVASVDPETRSAVLIGIPRDTYVTIHSPKGDLRNRINTAYVWGELYNYTGGGPALQMRTVGELLGIPIHNYVSVYFDGFSKLIDAIGGIDIDVPTAIRDSFTGWSFNTGMQHMDGKRALQYARSRYSTSDFSRGRRQQMVILAAVDKILSAGMLTRLPAILPAVAQSFRSDMSIQDLLAFASLGYKINRSAIKTAQVNEKLVSSWTAPGGAAVLLPKIPQIKTMVQEALVPVPTPTATPVPATPTPTITPGGPTPVIPTATATATPVPASAEGAKIEVLNGTRTMKLAARTQTWLQGQSLNVVRIADATGIYNQTVLYHDGTKPATADALIKLLKIKPENVRKLSSGGVNIRIILGTDAQIP